MQSVENNIALVTIKGLPEPLYYSLGGFSNVIKPGDEVLVPLARRKVRGWVVEKLTSSEFANNSNTFSPKKSSTKEGSKSFVLKEIISHSSIFPTEQFKLYRWMSDYYGIALSEVIANAYPAKLTQTKRRSTIARASEELTNARVISSSSHILNKEQRTAVDEIVKLIDYKQFAPLLLFGITGSGKTEVYLQAIEKVLNDGNSSLVIVPEIALTPQLLDVFTSRLNFPIAVLHSQVRDSIKREIWEKIYRGDIRLVIGARSAVFAPIQNLSLIIVDEEHEASYKQSERIRYNARDVAVMRAKFANCPVVLGSATPSFETLANVQRKRYKILELPTRVNNRPLPEIEVVNLLSKKPTEMPSANISPELFASISNALARNEQAIVLYNRRGFASYLQCNRCGVTLQCPNCSITFTYHERKDQLLCHCCNATAKVPIHCAICRDPTTSKVIPKKKTRKKESQDSTNLDDVALLEKRGAGTEKVFAELKTLFPQAHILQLDRDSVDAKNTYKNILEEMKKRRADILVGTQMISKGHDFPGVTVVGVIDADVGLHFPDFRSSEKTFQLLTQVAGRAGRGDDPGRVIIQTREPNHPAIVATASNRFMAFARYEMDYRKSLTYPPHSRLLRVVVSSTSSSDCLTGAEQAANFIRDIKNKLHTHANPNTESSNSNSPPSQEVATFSVLGPAPCPYQRLRGRYRWHIFVKSNSAKTISTTAAALSQWKKTVRGIKDFRLTVDVDPIDML